MGQAKVKGSYEERKAAAIAAGRRKKRFGGYVSGHGFLTAWLVSLSKAARRKKAHEDRVAVMAAMSARKDWIGRGVDGRELAWLVVALAACGVILITGVNALLW